MQVKLEYELLDVQKIKVNVEVVINLHLLMDQEKDD
jgi:hypothetical protein